MFPQTEHARHDRKTTLYHVVFLQHRCTTSLTNLNIRVKSDFLQQPVEKPCSMQDNYSLFYAHTPYFKLRIFMISPTTFKKVIYSVLGLSLAVYACSVEAADKSTKTNEVKVKDITLKIPANWKSAPPSNNLRLAQFEIPAVKGDKEPAELVISSFGGTGGGVSANISRWVGQFAAGADRKVKVTQGESKDGKYVFADLSGTYNKSIGPPFLRKTKAVPDSRMLGVILAVEGKAYYFLKLTGPKKTVSSITEEFRASFGANAKDEKPFEQ